jgi:hypothetical protein
MGTSLTGLTPSTTYDALIKVGDNGALSATAKYLSDGLGNDSPLAMSTTLVGIGTATPTKELEVSSTIGATLRLKRDDASVQADEPIGTVEFFTNDSDGAHVNSYVKGLGADLFGNFGRYGTLAFGVSVTANTDAVEVARFTESGYLRLSNITAGIQFNGDTAAANALDDYEEGTWTMGVSFGGGTTGITYSVNTGKYTKIGRQVTVNGLITLTSVGSSTGNVKVTGLPFTIPGNYENYSTASIWLNNVSFLNQFQAFGVLNDTTMEIFEITSLGAVSNLDNTNFGSNSQVIVSFTYFV